MCFRGVCGLWATREKKSQFSLLCSDLDDKVISICCLEIYYIPFAHRSIYLNSKDAKGVENKEPLICYEFFTGGGGGGTLLYI